jgi:hypothetical protein
MLAGVYGRMCIGALCVRAQVYDASARGKGVKEETALLKRLKRVKDFKW